MDAVQSHAHSHSQTTPERRRNSISTEFTFIKSAPTSPVRFFDATLTKDTVPLSAGPGTEHLAAASTLLERDFAKIEKSATTRVEGLPADPSHPSYLRVLWGKANAFKEG